jgi:putative intracellular protease/amidase
MPLVEEGDPAAKEAHATHGKPVAIVVFDGAEIIDFSGPWEVFGAAGYEVYTVAASREPVTTAMGMKVLPQFTFADAPQPAVLLVPGGSVAGARKSAPTLQWIRGASAHAEQTLSVCNGAFILAEAGLLDGLSATTTFHLIPKLAESFPKTKVVSDQRYVDNGKITTAAGLSAGIDGALHVVDKMMGRGKAQATAIGLEYDWHPDGGFVRGVLADRLIPDVPLDEAGTWEFERDEGTRDRWEILVRGTTKKTTAELHELLAGVFVSKGKWTKVSSTATSSEWTFADPQGKAWTAAVKIDPPTGDRHEYLVSLRVARAG